MSFIEDHICKRLVEIAEVPKVIGCCIYNTSHVITGIFSTALSVVTLGYSPSINASVENLNEICFILPVIYVLSLSIINPEVEIDKEDIFDRYETTGHFSTKLAAKSAPKFQALIESDNLIQSKIVSRVYLVGYAAILVVAKLADLVFAIELTAISFVTFGKFQQVNDKAYIAWKSLDVAIIPLVTLHGLINPKSEAVEDLLYYNMFVDKNDI